ncbi:hypothetical protein OAU36_03580 [Gammaproteobacteria bacterium]|jgi:hypothetical protein|nr:hypothetical protein [Gammaproteobacteria bacterium]MDC3196797.1 hypothetical protein [Gammaproteobacteria bacterium]HAS47753.1 hypothetical protein [Gammaproteobacteria bacterium]
MSKLVSRSISRVNALLIAVFVVVTSSAALADTYQFGQHIEPAYEGWRPNADGTFSFMFGYMNENWTEQPDVAIGDNNFFSPGDADRGQPTHFLPRRNRFTFEVVVPSDWGERELVWTLNVNGIERKAYATLKDDYLVDNMVIASETGSLGAGTSSPESRANIPPVVTIQGDDIRTARVGEEMSFVTQVIDDGLPKARRESTTSESDLQRRMMRPPTRITVGKVNGLFLSWNKYRGPGNVTFDPPMPKPWEDTRTSANSPWGALWLPPEAPEDGLYEVTATFDAPGTYILWGRADDGGLYHDGYITVNVTE